MFSGETLAEIWSQVVIDNHNVIAEYVPPGEVLSETAQALVGTSGMEITFGKASISYKLQSAPIVPAALLAAVLYEMFCTKGSCRHLFRCRKIRLKYQAQMKSDRRHFRHCLCGSASHCALM